MGISQPVIDTVPNGLTFQWKHGDEEQIAVLITQIEERPNHRSFDAEIEIAISENGTAQSIISGIRVNLLSASQRASLKKACKDNALSDEMRFYPWGDLVEQVCAYTIRKVRTDLEPVVILNDEYGKKRPEFLLPPLFVKNAANIIYADRSSAKSLFVILVDLILSLPYHDNDLGLYIDQDDMHKVLYCDWEGNAEITGWQKECLIRGLGLEFCDVPYLRCSRPLGDSVDYLLRKISEVKADIIIIDSLGMAVGEDLNLTPPAFSFFKGLRQLPVTPIIVAHTSKDANNKRKTVYGNAFYENEARSIWEAVKQQEPNSNELLLTLHQRKPPPFVGRHEPMGFRFTFEGDKIMVDRAEATYDRRQDDLSDKDTVFSIVSEADEPLEPKDIVALTNPKINDNSVRQYLARLKKEGKVKSVGRGYSLV